MSIIVPYPVVVPDAFTYSRQRLVADYPQGIVAGYGHIWGHRGKVLVPASDYTAQRNVVAGMESYTSLGVFWGTRSSSGATGRRITITLTCYATADARVGCKIVEANLDGTSSNTQTLTPMNPAPVDVSTIGLSAGDMGAMERRMGLTADWRTLLPGFGGEVDTLSHALCALQWTYRPGSSIGTDYQVELFLREETTERRVNRFASVLVAEQVMETTD